MVELDELAGLKTLSSNEAHGNGHDNESKPPRSTDDKSTTKRSKSKMTKAKKNKRKDRIRQKVQFLFYNKSDVRCVFILS